MRRGLTWWVAALAAATVMWWSLHPGAARVGPAGTPATAAVVDVPYVLSDGAVREGESDIRVVRGQSVRLIVHSDRVDELHVHGYELRTAVSPGIPAELLFVAAIAGRFEIELHHSHVTLGTLSVMPR